MSVDDEVTERDADEVPHGAKTRRRGLVPIIVAVALICAGIGAGAYVLWPRTPDGMVDLEGNIVVPDDPEATSPAFEEAADMVVDDGGEGFSIPRLGLHVALGSANEVDGVMNPPNFTSAFWIRNRGVGVSDADQGTVYVVAHSVQWGKAPGNYLQDHESVLIVDGDVVGVDGRIYQVTDVELIAKTNIGNHPDLWANTPGMLVFVTCLERNDHAASTQNLVVVGQLMS